MALRDNLLRARWGPDAIGLRAEATGGGTTLVGYYSRSNVWYEIDSYWEGRFLERVAPGAHVKTIANDRDRMKVLFDHGFDQQLGNKPLGPIDVLEERDEGPYFEVPLLDADYNHDFVLPALQGRTMDGRTFGSQLVSSFRFFVDADQWDQDPGRSDYNPDGIPERTITRVQVLEFWPVTFPANPAASAGVRSLTDEFAERLKTDHGFVERFTDRLREDAGPSWRLIRRNTFRGFGLDEPALFDDRAPMGPADVTEAMPVGLARAIAFEAGLVTTL